MRAFQVGKAGNAPDECEDAFCWNAQTGCCALADGATDSAFQRLWARLLVEAFVQHPPDPFTEDALDDWLQGWLPAVQQRWHEAIDWQTIPWHGLNKARQIGGQATFLGVCCLPDATRWVGVAVGDCNLFHISASGDLLRSAPLTTPADFGNAPIALSSINRNVALFREHLHWIEGAWSAGEHLLLATDALAAWLLAAVEAGEQPVQRLLALENEAQFGALVDELRASKQMRNDDTSLLVIRCTATPASEPDAPVSSVITEHRSVATGATARKRRRRATRSRRRKS